MMSHRSIDSTASESVCGSACACSGPQTEVKGIGRRDFVAIGAAALAMAALAACGPGDSITSPTSLHSAVLRVSDFPALATIGGVATTTVDGTPIAIVRTSSASFSVFSRICPHQGSTIGVTATGFRCPNHGATFNQQGIWVGGERTSSMQSYTTTFDATAGTITIA
jgi:Rieske Fe-S protein